MKDLNSSDLATICPDPVIGVDRQGIITLFNPAAEALLGYSAEEVLGEANISSLYHPPGVGREIKKLLYSESLGGKGQIKQHETHLIAKSGHIVPIQLSATLVSNNGEETGSVGFFHDMTAQKAFEETLKTLSITDSLTGLFNQRHFHTVLSQEVARSLRHGRPLSLLCVDLDQFKSVNDTLGHLEGDNLLRHTGEIIIKVARNNDHGFRYGGDEFMLLLPETQKTEAIAMASRLMDTFETNKTPMLMEFNTGDTQVSLSIGIAEFKPGETPDLFVKRADLAMYQSKKRKGNHIECAE